MAEQTAAEKIAAAKADRDAKNAALEGKFMDPQYDWVETLVQKKWLPGAQTGKVVASVLDTMSGDPLVEQVVNVVRRAYYAHENRPILDWTAHKEYRTGDRVRGPEGKVYFAEAPGISGADFQGSGATVQFKLEDPQPSDVAKPAKVERFDPPYGPAPEFKLEDGSVAGTPEEPQSSER